MNLLIQVAVSINVNKNNSVLVFKNIDCAPVAGNVDAPLADSVSAQRMVMKNRMKEFFFK